MLCTPRGEKRPPRGRARGNQGPTGWRLLIVISPPRGGRTYVIAPREDMAFGRTYRWPLPSVHFIQLYVWVFGLQLGSLSMYNIIQRDVCIRCILHAAECSCSDV